VEAPPRARLEHATGGPSRGVGSASLEGKGRGVLVEARVVGQRGAALEAREIGDPPGGANLPLHELIVHVVRAEVAAFADRERRRRFVRILSPEQIDAGAAVGKVDSGGRDATPAPAPDTAVAVALEAFGDGLYLVFVDDTEIDDLDALITVTPATRLRFVRLTALAGG
jgi:hypothetical protein